MKRLVVAIALAIVAAACSTSTSSDDDSTTTTTTVFGVLYLSSDASEQFKTGSVPVGGSVEGLLERQWLNDSRTFPETVVDGFTSPTDEWQVSLGPGFVQGQESEAGCFISKDFIFVQEITSQGDSVVDLYDEIDKVSEVGDVGYEDDLDRDPRVIGDSEDFNSDEFTKSVVHVRVVDGVDALSLVAKLLADGVPAAPEYAMSLAPRWQYGPGTGPIMAGPEIPGPEEVSYGPVNVIDSFDNKGNLAADFHGNFISGILNRLGVDTIEADVGVSGSNFATEVSVASSVVPGINNMSIGGHACTVQEGENIGELKIPDLNGDGDTQDLLLLPPIAIPAVLYGDPTEQIPGVDAIIVASAGNESTASRCHPETFPAMYASFTNPQNDTSLPIAVRPYFTGISLKVWSVGALTGDGSRASFSNCGDNTVWAPGVGIISDYGGGTAIWAGTSFASPIVAATIARGELNLP